MEHAKPPQTILAPVVPATAGNRGSGGASGTASLSLPVGPGRGRGGGPWAGAAVRCAPAAARTRSGTCGRRSWSRSPSPAQPPRLAPRADWPPAGNKGGNMQINALRQQAAGRGGAARGRGGGGGGRREPSSRAERVTVASRSFPEEQVRRRGRGSPEIHAGREKYDSTSRFLTLVNDVAPF